MSFSLDVIEAGTREVTLEPSSIVPEGMKIMLLVCLVLESHMGSSYFIGTVWNAERNRLVGKRYLTRSHEEGMEWYRKNMGLGVAA